MAERKSQNKSSANLPRSGKFFGTCNLVWLLILVSQFFIARHQSIMQISTFIVPVLDPTEAQAELNQFLRSHRVLEVQSQLVTTRSSHYWCYSVHWLISDRESRSNSGSSRKRVDYRQILDESTFAIFARLRECRKQIAQKESVPAYVIFTDAELAELAKLDQLTQQSMQTISGIGKKKSEKYAQQFISMMQDDSSENTEKRSTGEDS